VEGPCEHVNEPSGFIKCWEILEWVLQLAASQEGLSSMVLVIFGRNPVFKRLTNI
jgi:hypothetical protein